jgi:uncharacterized protein (TIRG00374 family)
MADGWWITAAFVILVLERLVAAWRMKLLTDCLVMPLTVLKIWEISIVSIFYSTLLPGDLAGGAVRWYRMSEPTGQRAQAFAALVVERLIETMVLILCGLLFWFWDVPPFGTWVLDLVLIALVGLLMLVMSLCLNPRASTVLHGLISWIPWQGLRRPLSEKTEKVLVSIGTFRQLSLVGMTAIVVLSILRFLLTIVIILCFAQSLSMVVGFSTIGWIRSLMNMVTMLPISFAGLGVREASYAILLEPYGIPGSQAIALALFGFIGHLVLAVVGGLLELRIAFLSRRTERPREI